jgi:hypothetical protein
LNPDSQIIVPPSFIELFRLPGRQRLSEPHAHIAARYELCEDVAQLLTERATAKLFELGITEEDVLVRMHEGLVVDGALVSPAEAWWVTQRLAELLGWPAPDLPAPSGPGGAQ